MGLSENIISMIITATHINYYYVCKRKLWLFASGIQMEHNSDLVSEGKLIHESTYPQRSAQYEELSMGPIKIDFYDKHRKVIHEIKKSNKIEEAHIWQVKYYILVMESYGISGVTGLLEYPKLRTTTTVSLSDQDRIVLSEVCNELETICAADLCPPKIKKSYCRSCSYFDFCYSNEDEI